MDFRSRPVTRLLFLTPAFGRPPLPRLVDSVDNSWEKRFRSENQKYAAELFRLAERALKNQVHSVAFQLLHESLFHDPENEDAIRVLGESRNIADRIRVNSYRANTRRAQDQFLPNGNIKKYESDNFVLFTSLEKKRAIKAIHDFEKLQVVWRQLFFSYWAKPSWLNRRFEKEVKPLSRSKKFRVVLYANKDEYIQKLSPSNPGIEVSIGYYWFGQKTSYFFDDDDPAIEKTWVHELTHQLMHESVPISPKTDIGSAIWAVEGIAVFMETLTDFGTHLTVGGEDAERLNYCRHNYFRRGFLLRIGELNVLSKLQFIRHPNVKELYSLSGSYCQFIMRHKSSQDDFYDFLRLVHQGKNLGRAFDKLSKEVSFDSGFKEFLKPDRAKIERSLLVPSSYKILYMGYSGATDATLDKLRAAVNLESLDLSGNAITDAGIEKIAKLKRLRYLSLERCKISDSSCDSLTQLTSLEELDLTSTAITDQSIEELSGSQKLIAFWIGGTRVSDQATASLLKMPALRQLDIRKSKISAEGRRKLQQKFELID